MNGVMAALLIAGATGGVGGSAVTALLLNRGEMAPAMAAAAPPAINPSQALPDSGLKAIYKQVGPAVVSVQTAAAMGRGTQGSPFPGLPGRPGTPNTPNSGDLPLLPRGEGTGFIVDAQGHILTNNHVVDGASQVTIVLQDGSRVTAQVVGSDPGSDLALLKASIPAEKLRIAALGDSDAVEPGDPAIAIGTPFGLDHTITAGIISAVDREFGAAGGRPMRGLIQTDAPINPGNSGGPLLNAKGEVIGITTAIESPVPGSVGIGFAIPINAAKQLLPRLQAGQTIQHAWLGIAGASITPDIAAEAGLPSNVTQGVLVTQVTPNSPAAQAGLRGGAADPSGGATAMPKGGDVIVAVDGRPVQRVQDIGGYLDTKQPGDTVTLTIVRNGARQDVRATLAPWPARTAR
jgi:S1-C subfamily serine protease